VLPRDLEPIAADERSVRAPRAELPETTSSTGPAGYPGAGTGPGLLGAPGGGAGLGPTGLPGAVTGAANLAQTVTPGAKRSGGRALLLVALAAVAGVGTGLVTYTTLRRPAESAPSTDATGSAAASEPSAASASSVETETPSRAIVVEVTIVPEGAKVTVDGQEQRLAAGGKLRLSGTAGQSFTVLVEQEGRSEKQTVVLTADGKAVPERIELAAAATSATATATAKATGVSGAGSPAPAPVPPKSVKMRETW
jgi:hypothetical protein